MVTRDTRGAGNRAELLNSLKIDRSDPQPAGGRQRPLKWFLLISVLAALALVGWFAPLNPFRQVEATAIPVQVARAVPVAAPESGASILDATGYVVARRQATVSAETTGKVIDVRIEEGDRVRAGQVLAVLDDAVPRAELALAQSRLQSAQAATKELDVAREQAELDLARTRELATRKLASQADLDRDTLAVESVAARLDRARQEVNVASRGVAVQQELLEDMEIRAPFDGVVVAKAAQPGEMISPISAGGGFTRTGICTIVDMDSLEVEVDVNEAYINRVRQGQPVQVSLNAYPDDHYAARVIAIIPTADRSKATVRVRVGFVDRDERVLPDMGVRVAFLDESERREPADATGVLVPKSSVAKDEQGDYVFLVRNDRAARRAVVAGEDIGRSVRVVSGLAPGEQVVVNPVAGIADGLSDGVRVSAGEKERGS